MSRVGRVAVVAKEIRLRRAPQMGPVLFHGTTMRPFLEDGDYIHVEPVAWAEIKCGDIITYRFEDKFPTRRVVKICRELGSLTVQGDNIPGWRDYAVTQEAVLGRAEVRVRGGMRLDRQSREWRRAGRRALRRARLVRAARSLPRPLRGLVARVAATLRFG